LKFTGQAKENHEQARKAIVACSGATTCWAVVLLDK
jgi:hypothetical protein